MIPLLWRWIGSNGRIRRRLPRRIPRTDQLRNQANNTTYSYHNTDQSNQTNLPNSTKGRQRRKWEGETWHEGTVKFQQKSKESYKIFHCFVWFVCHLVCTLYWSGIMRNRSNSRKINGLDTSNNECEIWLSPTQSNWPIPIDALKFSRVHKWNRWNKFSSCVERACWSPPHGYRSHHSQ